MRKPFILLLAIVYLGITSGVMVNVHYCMGRIAEVNYGHDDADKCGKCGMDQKNGCCTTEHKFVKSADEHLFGKSFHPHTRTRRGYPKLHSTCSAAANQQNV